jgi:hypothetical protein
MLDEINAAAFVSSDFPVILALEVHCNTEQATALSTQLRQVFGDTLYTLDDAEKDDFSKFSPETLKHKILVMYKLTVDETDFHKNVKECPSLLRNKELLGDEKSSRSNELCHTAMLAMRNTSDWGKKADCFWVSSYSESKIPMAYERKKGKFMAMCRKMFARAYPTREDSSNMDPGTAWAMGCQFVAMNYQCWDHSMRKYDAKFAANGHCGYLLKPDYLRYSHVAPPTQAFVLTVTVLLGAQIPVPDDKAPEDPISPFVTVRLLGAPEDMSLNELHRTKALPGEAFAPFWNESFEFCITNIELAMLTLSVRDQDTEGPKAGYEIAEATVPIPSLRLGYRAVPLCSIFDGDVMATSSVLLHLRLRRVDVEETATGESVSENVSKIVR